ncbi:MAG: hypothetical protein LWW94_07075 [Candidatus Desulfofervidaceae bacterium]|nr:hypothetical protein [Candidatus Desulfofervidaceae bacterium]
MIESPHQGMTNMNSNQKKVVKKLRSLLRSAEKFVQDLDELICLIESQEEENQEKKEDTGSKEKQPSPENLSVNKLREKTRDEAIKILKSATQKQLSKLFRELGGSSRNARKRKDFLIDRILWSLYDFEEGHNILKKTRE